MANLKNAEIRALAKEKSVRLWQIADELQVSEMSVSRKLRHELSDSDKEKFVGIINKISEGS